ncbi:small ribosomal subunit protein mS25-like [Sycon ciliatum]|uniref:small ribosomal subunit protein mS25-like n=1 Tax=Sycon ciliatum TaxID=27933 RepID=UPI0020AAF2C6|eukprot:scpid99380/ scgid32633/ Probable 28S ribosomal protein S25, mitochondrial
MSYGSFPHYRTYKHLSNVPFRLHPDVRVMLVNYHHKEINSRGLLKFIYERVPPLQFGHPKVQIVRQGDEPHKPLPYIEVFFHNGKRVFIDCENKLMTTITQTLEAVAGDIFDETDVVEVDLDSKLYKDPCDFRWHRGRKCICEIPGQSPCSVKNLKKNKELIFHRKLFLARDENRGMVTSL